MRRINKSYEVGVALGVHPAADVRAELSAGENAAEHLHHHREPIALVAACAHARTHTHNLYPYTHECG